ncbi:hypothetical protein Ancab_013849 [Ancistrocladus abbreviatus]
MVMPQPFPVGGSIVPSSSFSNKSARVGTFQQVDVTGDSQRRCFATAVNPTELDSQGTSSRGTVEEVRAQRKIPDIRPGYIVQLKVEVPENKQRITMAALSQSFCNESHAA